MDRNHQDLPEYDVAVPPYGKVRVVVNDANSLYVDACSNCVSGPNPQFVTINGVEVTFAERVFRVDGVWGLRGDWKTTNPETREEEHKFFPFDLEHPVKYIRATKRGSFDPDSASESARRKIACDLLPQVAAWANCHPEIMAQGAVVNANNDVWRAQQKVEEAKRDLGTAQEALEAAQLAETDALLAEAKLKGAPPL